MYEVVTEIARLGQKEFNAHQIALTIGRHPSQVQKDLDRLVAVGVLEVVPSRGAAKPLKRRKGKLARAVFSLPALIDSELGEYTRTAPAEVLPSRGGAARSSSSSRRSR